MTGELEYEDFAYGFQWGGATVSRFFCDRKRGSVTLGLTTEKYPLSIQIYVTKTGKVRIHDIRGEWTPPKEKTK